jgi:hypothetical protein
MTVHRKPTHSDYVRSEIALARTTGIAVRDMIGMSKTAWERRMSGRVKWRVEELEAVARALSLPLDRLTRGDGSNRDSSV